MAYNKNVFGKKYIATDEFGNRYYQGDAAKSSRLMELMGLKLIHRNNNRPPRWVRYGKHSQGQISPRWHGWLHHSTNELPAGIPQNGPPATKPWRRKRSLYNDFVPSRGYTGWRPMNFKDESQK